MTYDGSWRRPVERRGRIGWSQAYGDRATRAWKCVGKFEPASFSAAQFPRRNDDTSQSPTRALRSRQSHEVGPRLARAAHLTRTLS